jgi:hypothetical protein
MKLLSEGQGDIGSAEFSDKVSFLSLACSLCSSS